MAYENVKFRKRNLSVVEGYFYMMDEDSDTLLKKTDDGTTAFTYPLDTLMTSEVKSLEYDGVYFWSLEDGSEDDVVIIKRWHIDNYVCKLKHTYTIASGTYGGSPHKFDSNAFSVEHYHTYLTSPASSGTSNIYLNEYWDSGNISGKVLHIGPNSNGEYEDIEVSTTISGGVTLQTPVSYDYDSNDPVQYYTNIWLFNNFNGTSSDSGGLYNFSATNTSFSYVNHYPGGAYKDIQAATFYKVDSFTEYGEVDTLAYIKATNMLFVNTGSAGATLPYYGSMVMDNIQSDEATVIPVYDLSMDDQNVYRLQLKATYYGSTSTWSTYNYQMASLNSFVTSLALAAYPGILAANTVSTSSIQATVKDQFGQPVIGRLVYFTEDDAVGSITGGTPISTDSDGKAQTTYKSGNTAREVKITATVEQV